MIRLIVKSSCQVSEDEWSVFYETVDIEHDDLESKMKHGGRHIVGAEIVKTPTSDNIDYAKLKELIDSQEDIPSEIQKVLNENFTDLF